MAAVGLVLQAAASLKAIMIPTPQASSTGEGARGGKRVAT
jgi:hypothetical protein